MQISNSKSLPQVCNTCAWNLKSLNFYKHIFHLVVEPNCCNPFNRDLKVSANRNEIWCRINFCRSKIMSRQNHNPSSNPNLMPVESFLRTKNGLYHSVLNLYWISICICSLLVMIKAGDAAVCDGVCSFSVVWSWWITACWLAFIAVLIQQKHQAKLYQNNNSQQTPVIPQLVFLP